MCGTSSGPGPARPESGPIFENLRDRDQPQKLRSRENGHFSRKTGFLALENSIFLTPARTNYFVKFSKWTSSAFPNFYKIFGFFQKTFIFLRDRGPGPGFFSKNFLDRD